MKTKYILAAVICFASVIPLSGQGRASDEKLIWDLVTAADGGKAIPSTEDRIYLLVWPYKRPVVGSEKPEPIGAPASGPVDANLGRVPGSQRLKTTIVRLEIAESGEMAWEFSNSELSFDLTNGQHVTAPIPILRTWRKENGQWKQAAAFMRPHNQGTPVQSDKH